MFVRQQQMQPGDFEYESFKILKRRDHKIERVNSTQLWKRFPAWTLELYRDGVLELEAGYVESRRALSTLIRYDESLGMELREAARFTRLDEDDQRGKGT